MSRSKEVFNPDGPYASDPEGSYDPHNKFYSFSSRMKQTPVRSMLMAHGCCFDFFEKGSCKSGAECKYSHLKPGDERNLVMDSEAGLRKKKYYRPPTKETYLPGSQDVICFTFARKGWCIHGDKCWNQHISPSASSAAAELSTQLSGLKIEKTTPPQNMKPSTSRQNQTSLPTPPHSAGSSGNWDIFANRHSMDQKEIVSLKPGTKIKRERDSQTSSVSSSNWRLRRGDITDYDIPTPRSALGLFDWDPSADDICRYNWPRKGRSGKAVINSQDDVSLTPTSDLDELDLIDLADPYEYDVRKYRVDSNTTYLF